LNDSLSVGIVCFAHLGGSGIVATELAAGLARRGHTLHVFASTAPSRIRETLQQVVLHEVTTPGHPALEHPPYGLALASSLVAVAAVDGLDVVHVHYAIPHAASAYLARQMLGRAAPRIVATLHGSDVTQIGADPHYLPTTRFAVEQAEGVTVPSAYLQGEAYRKLGLRAERAIEVIPNFVDTERFTQPARRERERFDALFESTGGDPADRGAPVLFHVSSLRPVKRATDLVEVLARVRARRKARLVVVGDGPDRERLVARACELDVLRSVYLAGTRVEFVDLLQHADAFLFPSENESFGVAALEAASCGVPVLAYRVGGIPEVVTPETGRLVPPFDVDALAAAALEILTHESLRESLGRAARQRAETHFRREAAIDRYEAFYRRVLDRAPREVV